MLLQAGANDRIIHSFQKTPNKMALGFHICVLRKGSLYQRNSRKQTSQARFYKFHVTMCFVLRSVVVDIKMNCLSFVNDYVFWLLTCFYEPFVHAVVSLLLGWNITRCKTLTVTEYHA